MRSHILRVADLPVSVLIRGETGTGKEVVANAIHALSPRKKGPFRAVNLGTVEKSLAAAQLFGSKEGGFTGAKNTPGHFELANGGTLFLDELGELPLEVQPMLLRVLENHQVQPVGGTSPVAVDVRLISATDANLESQIALGRFKEPLLHRVAGYNIRIPPLRERREDIGPLIYHFAKAELTALGAEDRLKNPDPSAEPWLPAELVMRAALPALAWQHPPAPQRRVDPRHRQPRAGDRRARQRYRHRYGRDAPSIPSRISAIPGSGPFTQPPPPPPPAVRRKPSDVTEAEGRQALRAAQWEPKAAADLLGIPRPSIYDQARRWGVRLAGDLAPEEIDQSFRAAGGDVDAMVKALEVSKHALQRRLKELGLMGRRRGPAK